MTALRFRDLYEEICSDLGGVGLLSEGQKQLARRAAMLSAECERLEALAARDARPPKGGILFAADKPFVFDVETYGQLCDRLGRVFQRLGLERVAKPAELSLSGYLELKAKAEAEAAAQADG